MPDKNDKIKTIPNTNTPEPGFKKVSRFGSGSTGGGKFNPAFAKGQRFSSTRFRTQHKGG